MCSNQLSYPGKIFNYHIFLDLSGVATIRPKQLPPTRIFSYLQTTSTQYHFFMRISTHATPPMGQTKSAQRRFSFACTRRLLALGTALTFVRLLRGPDRDYAYLLRLNPSPSLGIGLGTASLFYFAKQNMFRRSIPDAECAGTLLSSQNL